MRWSVRCSKEGGRDSNFWDDPNNDDPNNKWDILGGKTLGGGRVKHPTSRRVTLGGNKVEEWE